jgi:thioredoxin 1
LEKQLPNSPVRHLKVADGKGKRLGREFRVKLWPNFVLLKDGEVLAQLARPEQTELAELLDSASAG